MYDIARCDSILVAAPVISLVETRQNILFFSTLSATTMATHGIAPSEGVKSSFCLCFNSYARQVIILGTAGLIHNAALADERYISSLRY